MYSLDYYKNMFKVKFEELERCHNNLSNYSLIQASNPIRSLLLDSQPLVDILNREKRLPITYCVNNNPWHDENEAGLIAILLWKELNPWLSDNRANLKKDTFLKLPCVLFMDTSITVHDVLKFYAYVRGGIHLDRGEEEYEPLREAFNTIKINGISSLDHSMRGIVQIIYTTLSKNKERLLG